MKKIFALIAVAFAVSATVGCGGSSSTPAAAPKPPTTPAAPVKPM